MQDDASGGLDVTLLVAVAALAPARVEYSLDRRLGIPVRLSAAVVYVQDTRRSLRF